MKLKKFIPIACTPIVLIPLASCSANKPFVKSYDVSDKEWKPELQQGECELSMHYALDRYFGEIRNNKEIVADDLAWSTINLAGSATDGTLELDIEEIDYNRHLVSINITLYTSPATDPSFIYKFKNIEMHGYYGQYMFWLEEEQLGWQFVPWSLFLETNASLDAAIRYMKGNEIWSLDAKFPSTTEFMHFDHTSNFQSEDVLLGLNLALGAITFQSYYLDKVLAK